MRSTARNTKTRLNQSFLADQKKRIASAAPGVSRNINLKHPTAGKFLAAGNSLIHKENHQNIHNNEATI